MQIVFALESGIIKKRSAIDTYITSIFEQAEFCSVHESSSLTQVPVKHLSQTENCRDLTCVCEFIQPFLVDTSSNCYNLRCVFLGPPGILFLSRYKQISYTEIG